ncbi:hypothetical protein DSO57_1004831 [Entomophthora muscae]|uniref:Uncharacterized protein n=1 Tax=Entomophthora muscae TaxID=34485 RepID=A0ACC2RMW4_9FUNG|nr:hypothetical protein DSO57_1004831 [Entomophthora muscae]
MTTSIILGCRLRQSHSARNIFGISRETTNVCLLSSAGDCSDQLQWFPLVKETAAKKGDFKDGFRIKNAESNTLHTPAFASHPPLAPTHTPTSPPTPSLPAWVPLPCQWHLGQPWVSPDLESSQIDNPKKEILQGCSQTQSAAQSGNCRASANSSNSNPTGLDADSNHPRNASQSESKLGIIAKPSNSLDSPCKISPAANQIRALDQKFCPSLPYPLAFQILQQLPEGLIYVVDVQFVGFTLAPSLVMIWSASPDLWGCISDSFLHVGTNPDQFLNIFEDIPSRTQEIYTTSENVMRSLACDDLEFPVVGTAPTTPPDVPHPMPPFLRT